jgi:DNA repair protein RadA/Sms
VFVNVVGGLRIDEPAADLAIAAAITSSMRDMPVRADTVLIGEVGLSGELRLVSQMHTRLREAAQLGFKTAVIPRRIRRGEAWPEGIQVVEARSLREALNHALLADGPGLRAAGTSEASHGEQKGRQADKAQAGVQPVEERVRKTGHKS